MADYISREAVLKCIEEDGYDCELDLGYYDHNVAFQEIIKELPAADVVERKRGEWKTALLDHEGFGVRPTLLYCSECHQAIAYKTNFCPNCGADMRREEV